MNDFIEKFKIEKLTVYENEHWVWSIRPEQITLGSSVLSLKRRCNSLSDLNKDEMETLRDITIIIEKTLSKVFGFEKINYMLLMMVDNQLHYHVIPRYSSTVKFNNINWLDYGWPSLPRFNEINISEESDLVYLKNFLADKLEVKKNKKYKIGYTTGVFDLFHVGHLNILRRAKEQCDYLIVGVTTDELVSYKNKKAVINLEDRMEIVGGIKYVDKVVVQENMNKMEAWNKYQFDVMFVGSDWQGTEKWNQFEREFEKVGVKIEYIPYTQRVSSTKLREELNKTQK